MDDVGWRKAALHKHTGTQTKKLNASVFRYVKSASTYLGKKNLDNRSVCLMCHKSVVESFEFSGHKSIRVI